MTRDEARRIRELVDALVDMKRQLSEIRKEQGQHEQQIHARLDALLGEQRSPRPSLTLVKGGDDA